MNDANPLRLRFRDSGFQTNPGRMFQDILHHGPVIRGRVPLMGKCWLATSWQACSETLRDTDDFVRDPANADRRNYTALQWLMPNLFRRLSQNMLARDHEDHRRLRGLVDKAFQRQSITSLESRIQEIVESQLDHIADLLTAGADTVDFVEHFARPLPLIVICELLGLPDRDRPQFMKWFQGFSNVRSLAGIFRVMPGLRRTMRYLQEQFAEVRQHPRDGLVTALVQAEEDGEKLDKDELLSTTMLLLLAGHETTVHLIANTLLTLLQFENDRHRLMADWSLCDTAIEEVLRYNSIIFMAKPRFVARDLEFHGQILKRGEMMVPLLGCSNYDPAEFDQPLEFRIGRSPNRHLMFGSGPHVCLGMKLARVEAGIATRQILQRWPGLQAGFDPGQPDFGKRLGMRTLKTLHLRCN